jgi:hypothetical protein
VCARMCVQVCVCVCVHACMHACAFYVCAYVCGGEEGGRGGACTRDMQHRDNTKVEHWHRLLLYTPPSLIASRSSH